MRSKQTHYFVHIITTSKYVIAQNLPPPPKHEKQKNKTKIQLLFTIALSACVFFFGYSKTA